MVTKTYPATLADLRRRVYSRCQASSTAKHSSTDVKIREAINDGQREVYNELRLKFKTRYFTKIADHLSPVNNIIPYPDDYKSEITFDKLSGNLVSGSRWTSSRFWTTRSSG